MPTAEIAGPPWYDLSRFANLVVEHPDAVRTIVYSTGVVASLISCRTVLGHLLNYTRPAVQRHIVRIQLLIPIYGLGSMLSLHVRRDAIYVDTVRDIYEAFVIYSFLQLVLAYLGGEDACARKMETLESMPHPPPLCCLEPVKLNGAFLRSCKRGAIQVRPIARPSLRSARAACNRSKGGRRRIMRSNNCAYHGITRPREEVRSGMG